MKNIIRLIAWGGLMCTGLIVNAQQAQLSGYVRDNETGEDLIGVSIRQQNGTAGAITNVYGFYSLTVPKGEVTLLVSYVGYEPLSISVDMTNDLRQNFKLIPSIEQLNEVVITGEKDNGNIENNEMSVATVKPKTIKEVPAVLGEADVIWSIQLLPGVTSASEGSSGFNVRGGSADQNLILLDEGIIYNSSHLFGLFSVINPDAIKDVKLYKGGIPARYGGRASSVLDIRQREGNNKSFSGSAGVSLVSAKAMIEGPIYKDKSSYMVAARRSYGDALLRAMGEKNTAYFYDLNVKANYTINDNNRVFLSGYFGRDKFEISGVLGNSWGNTTSTIRWNHLFSDKLFANASIIYSNYDYTIDLLTSGSEFNWKSNIITVNTKADFGYFINNNSQFDFGFDHKLYEFRPGEIKPINGSNVEELTLDQKYAQEVGVYAHFSQKLGSLTLDGGLRFSSFLRTGSENIAIYQDNKPVIYNETLGRYENGTVTGYEHYGRNEIITSDYNLAPRLSATYIVNEQSSIKASYNRMYQYLHLISNTNSPTPLDIWTPTGQFIKPQESDQIALGYFRNFADNMYETSIEGYYKTLNNLVDYVDGADLIVNNNIETEVLSGSGEAYGLELYIKKNKGNLTGWVSYTLSKTERQVKGIDQNDPGINHGNLYSANYDKRNDLSVTAMYKLSPRLKISSNFIYTTGAPTTYPSGRYEFSNLVVPHYEGRNQQRLPDYHRLDISATLKTREKTNKKTNSEWTFGVYNIYNRKNANSIYFIESDSNKGESEAYKSYMFGIMPSIMYSFTF